MASQGEGASRERLTELWEAALALRGHVEDLGHPGCCMELSQALTMALMETSEYARPIPTAAPRSICAEGAASIASAQED